MHQGPIAEVLVMICGIFPLQCPGICSAELVCCVFIVVSFGIQIRAGSEALVSFLI